MNSRTHMQQAYCSGCMTEDLHSDGALWLHVIFALLLIKLALFFCRCILVLLVFGNKIIHVALSLCELHLIHTLTSIPMKEGFPSEHRCEILCYAFKHFLNGCTISCKSDCHFEAFR